MIRVFAFLTLLAGNFVGNSAGAAESATRPDSDKGRAIVTQVCAACHSADGNSVIPVNPRLAGQIADYLVKQMTDFKAAPGKKAERENPVMGGMVAGLSPDDMRNVAAYLSTQQMKPGAARNKSTLSLGQKLWRAGDAPRGIPACSGCHGANGSGIPSQYPRLSGQFAEYTEAQLKAFRAGARANDTNKVMRTIAARMSDAEISAVADYATGLH